MARTRRIPLAVRYPKVLALKERGFSHAEIGRRLRPPVGKRQVAWILANGAKLPGEEAKLLLESPDPIPDPWVKPELLPMKPYTVESFEYFFNRYSEWTLAPHSRHFVEQALGREAVLLNVPPRHAKSEIFSVWLPLWHIARNRDVQILLISKTLDQALKFTREMAEHLEGNDKLIEDFGRFQPDSKSAPWSPSTGRFMVAGRKRQSLSGDLTIMARGAGQKVYGFAADLIIADDVVDEENSETPESRRKLERWFHNIVETRLQPDAPTWVVGTRFHEDDLYGHLASLTDDPLEEDYDVEPRLWTHINFPAVSNWERKEVLWPEVWSFERLMKKRRRIGSAIFDQAYQQNPIPSDERLVQPEWIQGCFDRDRSWGPQKKFGTRVISIDPSPTKMWGWVIADVASDRNRFFVNVLEVFSRKMGVREAVTELEQLARAYSPDAIIFEKNAAQRWFFEDLGFIDWRKRYKVKAIDHETGRNKVDPVQGFQSIGADFEAGTIRLPGASLKDEEAMEPLTREALSYPYGRTDDVLMALWEIKAVHQRVPFLVKNPTEPTGRKFHMPKRLEKQGFAWMRSA